MQTIEKCGSNEGPLGRNGAGSRRERRKRKKTFYTNVEAPKMRGAHAAAAGSVSPNSSCNGTESDLRFQRRSSWPDWSRQPPRVAEKRFCSRICKYRGNGCTRRLPRPFGTTPRAITPVCQSASEEARVGRNGAGSRRVQPFFWQSQTVDIFVTDAELAIPLPDRSWGGGGAPPTTPTCAHTPAHRAGDKSVQSAWTATPPSLQLFSLIRLSLIHI